MGLDFGLGHDLRVVRMSPTSSSMLDMETAEDSLSLALSSQPLSGKEVKGRERRKEGKEGKRIFLL